MSPTDEEIREMIASLRESAGGKYALGPSEYWHIDRAADALESLQSDLSTARKEIARISRLLVEAAIPLEAVNMAGGFNGYSPEVNRAMCDSMMSIRLYMAGREALRSSRTKGE